jgi:hypothetical protein
MWEEKNPRTLNDRAEKRELFQFSVSLILKGWTLKNFLKSKILLNIFKIFLKVCKLIFKNLKNLYKTYHPLHRTTKKIPELSFEIIKIYGECIFSSFSVCIDDIRGTKNSFSWHTPEENFHRKSFCILCAKLCTFSLKTN